MEQVEKLARARHSLAHLLAAAVLELNPHALPTIGPAIENGFYYDFDFSNSVYPDEHQFPDVLKAYEEKMREIVKSWEVFKEIEVTADEAKKIFANNPYKLELIAELETKKEKITLYYSGPSSDIPSKSVLLNPKPYTLYPAFLDLCRGGHIENPKKEIDPSSWKLERTAGAYWRGDEKNKMLTRIYGLAFGSASDLAAYEKQLEEAKKRDHKKLGRELDLFTFSELVGAGLPLWTPKGTVLRDILDNFVWELRKRAGYERVEIPHITKKDLYETSGHWEKFQDELFKITTREGHLLAMKPMNCPHHAQIYARKAWSYRELPQRYANTTMCYRDEQTGELSGLSRARSFTQDDAHVFCRMSQAKGEILKIWDIVHEFYSSFGFNLKVRLSLHDPKRKEKYLGGAESWTRAETILREIISAKKVPFFESAGEAAFYGPKLDFMADDSLGRHWQLATIQFDMNMPERFDLSCTNEKGKRERIVMIHAAIMGSIERFLSIIIEHFAGTFPLWLAPVQVKIIPIGEKHFKAAESAAAALSAASLRVDLDLTDEGFGKKVRQAKQMKIPYFIIIGDKDVAAGKVTLESRDKGNLGQLPIGDIVEKLLSEIKGKK